jgi:transposase
MLSVRYGLILFNLFEFEQNVRNPQCGVSSISIQETKRREIFTLKIKKLNGMKKIVKQIVGIDVAQKNMVVSLGRMFDDWSPELYANKTFANTDKGMQALVLWVKNQTDDQIPLRFIMEATGVYHEILAYFLEEKGYELTIVLPNKISNYMRTLEVKTVTDKTASQAIVMFGLERKLDSWQKPKDIYMRLRQLTRERDQLIGERTLIKNQLHAERSEAHPNKSSIKRMMSRIEMLNKQEKDIRTEVSALIAQDDEIKKMIVIICSLPGIGLLTAAIVLAETKGFELIRNRRQLASYAGFDVREKESGTSVKGKSRISKRGNKYLRKAMHFPALVAIKHSERYKAIFARLVSKHGVKMKAAVAVQRKLLEMIYILYKTKRPYDENYLSQRQSEQQKEKCFEKILERS